MFRGVHRPVLVQELGPFSCLYICRLDVFTGENGPSPLIGCTCSKTTHAHKHTNTGLHGAQTLQQRLIGIERYVLTHPCAPQACAHHKGPCHTRSRDIPAVWCQFVHLTLRLQIHSSERLQLKATPSTLQLHPLHPLRHHGLPVSQRAPSPSGRRM